MIVLLVLSCICSVLCCTVLYLPHFLNLDSLGSVFRLNDDAAAVVHVVPGVDGGQVRGVPKQQQQQQQHLTEEGQGILPFLR